MDLPELTWGAASDPGLRQDNQDRYLISPPIFAVADGMGGHVGGAQASEQAIAQLAEAAHGPTVAVEQIRAALERADTEIMAMGEHVDLPTKPGTTVAGLALIENNGDPYWAVFHVGDSRIYRWTARRLERVSTDHSVVQELVYAGAITEEGALTHPQRHVITKALGFGDRGQADFTLMPVERGQRFLMCSDGLTEKVGDERIAELLAADVDEQTLAGRLVAEAVQAGARDNVTVVVVQVGGQGEGGRVESLEEATIPRLSDVTPGDGGPEA